jgi:hypothetical protein
MPEPWGAATTIIPRPARTSAAAPARRSPRSSTACACSRRASASPTPSAATPPPPDGARAPARPRARPLDRPLVSGSRPSRKREFLTSIASETQMHPDAGVASPDSGTFKVHLCLAGYQRGQGNVLDALRRFDHLIARRARAPRAEGTNGQGSPSGCAENVAFAGREGRSTKIGFRHTCSRASHSATSRRPDNKRNCHSRKYRDDPWDRRARS